MNIDANIWLNDIDTTIDELLQDKPTKDKIIFLNSLFGVKKGIIKETERIKETVSTIPGEYSSYLKDELEGANLYINLYINTKDTDFLKMAYDECTHAKKFIDMSHGLAVAESDKLSMLLAKINRLKTNANIN
jgi:hypothetical protein